MSGRSCRSGIADGAAKSVSAVRWDPVSPARELLAFHTINPPGSEQECALYLGRLLEDVGFETRYLDFAERRASVVATLSGTGTKPPICFTGHLDTVPLGAAAWTRDPFGGTVIGGELHRRGAWDMKAVAAAGRSNPEHRYDRRGREYQLGSAELYFRIAESWCGLPASLA